MALHYALKFQLITAQAGQILAISQETHPDQLLMLKVPIPIMPEDFLLHGLMSIPTQGNPMMAVQDCAELLLSLTHHLRPKINRSDGKQNGYALLHTATNGLPADQEDGMDRQQQ